MRSEALTVMVWALALVVSVGALAVCWLIYANIWSAIDVTRFENKAEKDMIRRKYQYDLANVAKTPSPFR